MSSVQFIYIICFCPNISENNLLVGHHVTSDYVGNVTYFPLASLDNVGQPRPPLGHFYRPQRSCGQGNIFTPVCHSFCSHGGRRESTAVHAGIPPLPPDQPHHHPPQPGTSSQTRHPHPHGPATPPPPPGPGTPCPGPGIPPDQPPPGKLTPAYSLRAAGMCPTGMHSCFFHFHVIWGKIGQAIGSRPHLGLASLV